MNQNVVLDPVKVRNDHAEFYATHTRFNEEALLAFLPDLIAFLHWVERNRDGLPIAFCSRDCYHMLPIFRRMYPNTAFAYVGCSRKAFMKASEPFKKYIAQYKDYCFVDLHGSGAGHTSFWNKHFGHVPKVLMFSPYRPYEFDTHYFHHDHVNYSGVHIETIMAAPHLSVVDVDSTNNFVFAADEDGDDHSGGAKATEEYLRRNIIENVGPRTSWHPAEQPVDREIPGIKKGIPILGLDIDGTTLCENMTAVANLVRDAQDKFNIVVVTGRDNPIGIPLKAMGLTEGCPIFYNSTKNHSKIPDVKKIHLAQAHMATGINYSQRPLSILLDNEMRNIQAARDANFTGILTTCESLSTVQFPS